MALFPDTYDEANGVATLSRQLANFASARGLPFLVVRGGSETAVTQDGSLEMLELKRGAASFRLDKSLYCDPFLTRHKKIVLERLRAFQPDLVHITGPGDLGFLGLWVAHCLRIPLVASWHTNFHEYLARRVNALAAVLPERVRSAASNALEDKTLQGLMRFYRMARFVLAPNQTYVDLLHARTGKPAFLMRHGVDLTQYNALLANRKDGTGRAFCIGYVGRLTAEKNVCVFAELEQKLLCAGEQNFKFLIVGDGGQRDWLRRHLKNAEMPGVLRGEQLAAAYSHMDAFVFPSRTDTFGLVILEAMASGIPVIVAPETGLRVGIQDGISGLLSNDIVSDVQRVMHDLDLRATLSSGGRAAAAQMSWDGVFEQLFQTYEAGLALGATRPAVEINRT